MTPENFVFWMQGLMELGDPKQLNEKQTEMIKQHLALVFTNVTANSKSMKQFAPIPKRKDLTSSPPTDDNEKVLCDNKSLPGYDANEEDEWDAYAPGCIRAYRDQLRFCGSGRIC
mgnify:FL=1